MGGFELRSDFYCIKSFQRKYMKWIIDIFPKWKLAFLSPDRDVRRVFKGALSGLRQFMSTLKLMKNVFCFTLKALFVLKIFKFFSWLFWSCIKTTWLERSCYFWNLWRYNLVNKQLQYTYCPISQEVKATRQWNLVS